MNSQQKINMSVYIHWTSTAISHIGPKLSYLNVNIDARTTHNPHYAKFPDRLAKVAQTMLKRCTPGNDAVVAMMSPHCSMQQGMNFA